MSKTDLARYRSLPYTRRCQLMHEGTERYWHAWVEELPGCEVDGETKPEAFALLAEVFDDYITAKLEWASTIPEPTRWPNLGKSDASVPRGNTIIEILEAKKGPGALRSYQDGGLDEQSIGSFETVGA